jgi:prevent-host-death family protein
MLEIGVRDLKIHASEIVRKVKEKRACYIITHRGHPVAAIVPVGDTQWYSSSENSAWDDLVKLGRQISLGWQSARSSTDNLSETRK